MSTIHLHQTTATPEQFVAGLTGFGQGRAKLFPNSADDYRHRRPNRHIGGGQRSVAGPQSQCPAACPSSMCSVSPVTNLACSR